MSELVTALGDALFATSALLAASKSKSLLALGGFGLVGSAAVIGTLRFAGMHQLIPLHTFMSGFAGDVGIPMIGAAFFLFAGRISPGKFKFHQASLILISALVVGTLLSTLYLSIAQQDIYHGILGLLGIGLVFFTGVRHKNKFAMAGAALFLVGSSFGFNGTIGPFNRVDIFHVCGAVAWYLMSKSLSKLTL